MSGRRERDAGLSLVEVVIAMMLLGIIAVALIPPLWQGMALSVQQSSTATATRHLNALVEAARDDPRCANLDATAATQTIQDGRGQMLTSSGTVTGCAVGATARLQLSVSDASGATLAGTTALVYIP